MSHRANLVVTVVAVLFGAGCSFEFDRTIAVEPGEVTGLAQRADKNGEPATFAQVAVQGGSIVRRTFGDGTFAVRGLSEGPWLLRFSDDDDNDGVTERTAFSAARIVKTPEGDKLTSVLLGNVGLDGTFDMSGTVDVVGADGAVTPGSLGLLARVVLTRELCVPEDPSAFTLECGKALADRISVGVEAEASVDDGGAFVLAGVGSGPVFLYALLFAPTSGGSGLGALVAVASPLEVDGLAGDVDDVGALQVDPIADAAAPVSITIALSPPPSDDVRLLFSVSGALPSCKGDPGADVIEIDVDGSGAPADAVSVEAPPGILDVTACVGDDSGFLAEALIVPPVDADNPALLGPIQLRSPEESACGDPRDCDGDGFTGLPPLVQGSPSFPADSALWSACSDPCKDAFGSSGAVCTLAGGVFDCDDDGDGQPDVTESPACYGVGLGTDLDGDGLCSGGDPFPTCAANTADACPSGETVRAGARDLLDDICEATPPIPVASCAHWSALDEDGDEDFLDGPNDEIGGLHMDAHLSVVRFTSTHAGVLELADHDLFLPNGNFTWTRNDIHAGFPDFEIWPHTDGAGRLIEQSSTFDDDFDGVIDRRERDLFVPGRNSIEAQGFGVGLLEAVRYENDTGDCKPARVSYFSYDAFGVPTHTDIDSDSDGVIDESYDVTSDGGCAGGPPCTEAVVVSPPGDPPHTIRVTRAGAGVVVRSESDRDGDGVFESAADFSPDTLITNDGVEAQPELLDVERDTDGNGSRDILREFTYDPDGVLITRVTHVDDDGDGVRDDFINTQDLSPVFHALLRTKQQGDVDNDGVIDFTNVNEFATLEYASPQFTFNVRNDSAPGDSEDFNFVQDWSIADGCLLPGDAVPCTADADCAALSGHQCNLWAPQQDDASAEGFSLARFCSPVNTGAAAGAPCTGPSFNNPQCASGLCDDGQSGRCVALCTSDAECGGGESCVGQDAFGIAGAGYCATPCARQGDCAPTGTEQRSCMLQRHVGDAVERAVCDGERGFAPPYVDADLDNGGARSCVTHLMIAPDNPTHPNVCTEVCSAAVDCDHLGQVSTCVAGAAVDPFGPVAVSVCVPP